jgi:Mce-associated membrane protein
MPPPRRRRPVQPATHVRLPRTARPHATPANGTVPATQAEPIETTLDETESTEAGPVEASTVEIGTGEADAGEADTGESDSPGADEIEGSADAGDEDWADDDDLPEAAVELPAAEAGREASQAQRESLLLPICIGVITIALAGLAIWFGVNTGTSAGSGGGFGTGTANLALTDSAATAQVNQQIDNAVDTIFSYNYTDTARTADAAKNLVTGRASAEYATLFKVVQQDAPAEKLVLTTTVTNSGVEMLNANTARLLIFANQRDTGATKGSTTDAGAMFSVTAVRQDGRWKIENIDTFSTNG